MRSETTGFDISELRRLVTPRVRRFAHSRRRKVYVACKTVAERIAAVLLLLCAAPILVLCALLVKFTSAGPILYSQIRLGRNSRPFRMHKLRTMSPNSEADTGPVWSTPNDTRVTRVGRFLRDTHLDELPQLWNVLVGDMSLIGPRPERPEISGRLERAFTRYHERLIVRPGMTGLAQTQLPSDSNLEGVRRKLAYDLHYVQRIGPLLDLRIAVSTLFYLISVAASAVCRELIKSERRAAETRVESIEMLEDHEACEIGTS